MENLQHWRSSCKAYQTQLTKLHWTITEILDSSERPDESQLDSLFAFVEKLQWKAKAIEEFNAIIAGELQEEEELERDVFEAVEIQGGITQRVDQIKCFISCHANPIEPLPQAEFLITAQV